LEKNRKKLNFLTYLRPRHGRGEEQGVEQGGKEGG